tara:strand:+ start:127 stop:618 length:492 start_codon:yes stop_codon:yes gene_type:complete
MNNHNLRIRKATKSDAKFLLNTYNYGVRKLKFVNKDPISFKSHLLWLYKNLKKKNVYIYIATKIPELKKVGYIRFEKIKTKTWEISIANNPFFHGKGYGSKFIQKTLNKFKGKNKFIAIVKNNNKESLNFFLKNKFKKKQNKRYLTQKQISSTNFSYFELNQK